MQAAFDEDEQTCFCFVCAYKWLDHLDDKPDPPPARPLVERRNVQLRIDA